MKTNLLIMLYFLLIIPVLVLFYVGLNKATDFFSQQYGLLGSFVFLFTALSFFTGITLVAILTLIKPLVKIFSVDKNRKELINEINSFNKFMRDANKVKEKCKKAYNQFNQFFERKKPSS